MSGTNGTISLVSSFQDASQSPVQRLRWPRELQRTGVLWEPHVWHQHEANRGQSCPIWHHSQHSLHGGIVGNKPCRCLLTGSVQLSVVVSVVVWLGTEDGIDLDFNPRPRAACVVACWSEVGTTCAPPPTWMKWLALQRGSDKGSRPRHLLLLWSP